MTIWSPDVRSPASMTPRAVTFTIIKVKPHVWMQLVGGQRQLVDILNVKSFDIDHRVVIERRLVPVVVLVVVVPFRHLPASYRTVATCDTYTS